MMTKGGRAIDRNMPLTNFLAKLTCAEKASGAMPEHLYASARTPGPPGDPPRPLRHWAMSARGHWAYLCTPDRD
jgi:hypothetical protein